MTVPITAESARIVHRARIAHPELLLDDATFLAFYTAREHVADAHLGDLYLACAVARNVAGAAEKLETQCIVHIPRALSRIDRSSVFVAEIQQRIREKMCVGRGGRPPRIAEYGGRGSLAAFIRIAAIREALMEKRAENRVRPDALDDLDGIVDGDLALEMMRREYHGELQQALRAAIATLERHERTALCMSYLDNLSIDQIGRMFQVHRATAARWITRAQTRVREETIARVQRRLQLDDHEVDAFVADLISPDTLSASMLMPRIAA